MSVSSEPRLQCPHHPYFFFCSPKRKSNKKKKAPSVHALRGTTGASAACCVGFCSTLISDVPPDSYPIVWTHLFSSFYPGKQPAYQEHPPAATRSGRSLATPFARPQGHAARGTCGLQCVRGMCPHDSSQEGTMFSYDFV